MKRDRRYTAPPSASDEESSGTEAELLVHPNVSIGVWWTSKPDILQELLRKIIRRCHRYCPTLPSMSGYSGLDDPEQLQGEDDTQEDDSVAFSSSIQRPYDPMMDPTVWEC